MSRARPPSVRVIGAFLCSAAVAPTPIAAVAIASAPLEGAILLIPLMIFGFIIAMVHVIVLAVPAYLLVRLLGPVTWWAATLSGLAIGTLPAALIMSGSLFTILPMGVSGAAGGLTFWLVLRGRRGSDSATDLRNTFA